MIIIFTLLFCSLTQRIYDLPKYDEQSYLIDVEGLENDETAIRFLQNLPNGTIIGRKVLQYAICKGWNNTSYHLIMNHFNPQEIDLYQTFTDARKCLKIGHLSMFNNLTKLLPEDSVFLNIIEPCYLWAQNMTHLFLKIKFTIKLDVPGVVEINRLDTNITMPQFYLNAYSFHSTPLRFMLRIETYKFMNPHHYNQYQAELGQVVYEILKSPSPYFWRNVHSDWFYNPPNQYIWWDMYYQYREQLKVSNYYQEIAFGLMDDAENMREDKEEKNLLSEDKLIQSKKQFKQRLEEEKFYLKQEQLLQMYCRLSPSQKSCYRLDSNQWSSWIL